jgi:uncharacterized protein (TIGR03435 family)
MDRRALPISIAVALIGACAWAQPASDTARFSLASVRPAVPQEIEGCLGMRCGGPAVVDPAFRYLDVPLLSVLEWAYGKRNFQIFGGPGWLTSPFDSPRFDLVAIVPTGTSEGRFNVMLQTLLADRFGLKVHHETRSLPINRLVIAKGGPKVKEMPKTNPSGSVEMRTTRRKGDLKTLGVVPIETLLSALQSTLNEVVVDKTGLTGMYEFSMEWDDAPAVGAAPPLPNLATALEQGLGLKLEKGNADFDVLVVDHIEKTPTAN